MARVVSVTANLHGVSLGQAAQQVTAALASLGAPPPRTRVDLRGQVVPLQELLDGFRSGIVLAIVAIFLLLAANFQSVRLAASVVSTVPAVIAGVVLMLWLTGTTLNLQSAIGAIMAVGVAVANAILLVTVAEHARTTGRDRLEAAVMGAQGRLRAIPDDQCGHDCRHGAAGARGGGRWRSDGTARTCRGGRSVAGNGRNPADPAARVCRSGPAGGAVGVPGSRRPREPSP